MRAANENMVAECRRPVLNDFLVLHFTSISGCVLLHYFCVLLFHFPRRRRRRLLVNQPNCNWWKRVIDVFSYPTSYSLCSASLCLACLAFIHSFIVSLRCFFFFFSLASSFSFRYYVLCVHSNPVYVRTSMYDWSRINYWFLLCRSSRTTRTMWTMLVRAAMAFSLTQYDAACTLTL